MVGLVHPMAKAVKDRMDKLMSFVKAAEPDGAKEEAITAFMQFNYGTSVRTTREYLRTLSDFGKIRLDDTRYHTTGQTKEVPAN